MTIENPPAFPRTGEGVGNPIYDEPGMLLRDWFAGQALMGLLAGQERDSGRQNLAGTPMEAFYIADAMLAARRVVLVGYDARCGPWRI